MENLLILVCMVMFCHDGDTCKCKLPNNDTIKVRLLGIDTPEVWSQLCKAQPYSRVATKKINELVKGKEVTIYSSGKDKYGRTLGYIYLDGKDINLEMIKLGLAEVYRGKPDYRENPYYVYENIARNESEGMWWLYYRDEYESPRKYRKRCYKN